MEALCGQVHTEGQPGSMTDSRGHQVEGFQFKKLVFVEKHGYLVPFWAGSGDGARNLIPQGSN